MKLTASSPAATAAALDDTKIETIDDDRLEGSEAIGRFISPNMPLRTVRRLLEAGYYPCWREGRQYVASKTALIAHWREMTGGFSPQQPAKSLTSRALRRCSAAAPPKAKQKAAALNAAANRVSSA